MTSISRRRFLAVGAMAAAAAAVPVVNAEADDDVRISRHPVRVPNLPAELTGVTVAHVTDLHFYDPEPHPAGRRALAILEREKPDLLVLTGDQWDYATGAEGYLAWLRARPAGLPAIAVLGNHEYFTGQGGREEILRAAHRVHDRGDATLLANTALRVPLRGSSLAVVGLDDLRHGRPHPDQAARGLDPDEPQLWLFHEPALADGDGWPREASPFLMLAGHTHGGQIRLPLVPAVTPRGSGRYLEGFYQATHGRLYVSRGVGASGLPFRYRCPAEVALFELQPRLAQ